MGTSFKAIKRELERQNKKKISKQKKHIEGSILKAISMVCCISLVYILGYTVYCCCTYFGYSSWDKLDNLGTYNLELSENDYYYSLDEYLEIRYSAAINAIDQMNEDGLLDKKLYKYLNKGVNHEYFKNSTIISYAQYQEEADTFIEMCSIIDDMAYEEHDHSHICNGECKFIEYMQEYIKDEYREKLSNAHNKYHAAIEAQLDVFEMTDSELKYYYELFLVSDLDNIEEIEVDLTYITCNNMKMNDAALNWYVRSKEAGLIRNTKTLTLENRAAIEYLKLSVDAGLYDDSIASSVINILYAIGDEIEGKEDSNMAIIDITGIEDYSSYINKKLAEKRSKSNIRNTKRFFPISITDRYEGEQAYILFDVISCKHKDDLPSYEEFLASEKFGNTIVQMLENDFWNDLYESLNESVGG